MFAFEPPRTTEELTGSLGELGGEIEDYLGSMDLAVFEEPQGEHWSPAEHLSHLTIAVRAVAGAMARPRFLLALRFGLARGGSGAYEEVVDGYRTALARGAVALGPFDPRRRPPADTGEKRRERLLRRWRKANKDLLRQVETWPGAALDRYRLPHPLIGKLTVREILYFTLYHNAHHARRIVERAGRS